MHPVIYRALSLLICLAIHASAQSAGRGAAAPRPAAASAATTERDPTVLGALSLLPKDAATRVARLEGPDGRPFPERWYVLIHDAAAPRGLREFVFADGKLVTSRALSQFADSISADDVVGAASIKINSDQAAGIAAQFAMHNGKQLGGVRYELAKAETSRSPVWHLSCSDANGQPLGMISLHATKGTLLSFQGFEKSPMVPEPETIASAQTAETAPRPSPATKPVKRASSQPAARSERSSPPPPPRAVPVRRVPPPREGPVDRVGGVFRRIFRD
jgi:hypothetical protein